MRLALCQPRPTDGDLEAAFDRLDTTARAAALAGADLLVMPELFLPGYNRPDLHARVAQPVDGDWTERASKIARAAGIALVFGFAERAGDRVYNSALALSATGARLAHFRKLQLFGPMEEAGFTPGDAHVTFQFGPHRIGLLICYDIEFPSHARALAQAGVDVILVPTANPSGFDHVSDVIVPARAAENGIVVAYANYAGAEGDLSFDGTSVIAGPGGVILAQAGGEEALLLTTLPAAPARDLHGPASAERRDIAPPNR